MFESFEKLHQYVLTGTEDQLRDLIYRLQEEKFRWAEDVRNAIRTEAELKARLIAAME